MSSLFYTLCLDNSPGGKHMSWFEHFKYCSQQARMTREKAKTQSVPASQITVDASSKRKVETFNLLEANGIDSLSQSDLADYFKD